VVGVPDGNPPGEFVGAGCPVGAADGSIVGDAIGSGIGVIDGAGIAATWLSLMLFVVKMPIPKIPVTMIRIAILFCMATSLFA